MFQLVAVKEERHKNQVANKKDKLRYTKNKTRARKPIEPTRLITCKLDWPPRNLNIQSPRLQLDSGMPFKFWNLLNPNSATFPRRYVVPKV